MQKTPWFHEEQADVMLNYLPLRNVLVVKNKALPDSARPCKHPRLVILSLSLSLSLPRRLGPIKAGLTCLLSLSRQRHSSYTVPPGSCQGWTPASHTLGKKYEKITFKITQRFFIKYVNFIIPKSYCLVYFLMKPYT